MRGNILRKNEFSQYFKILPEVNHTKQIHYPRIFINNDILGMVTNISCQSNEHFNYKYTIFFAEMAKSRAEIQKAYRQRQKEKNNERYLAKERQRRRSTYIPNSQLSKSKKEERNRKNREYLKLYRRKKKEAADNVQNVRAEHQDEINTSGYESGQSGAENRMLVRMNFPQRANGPRMRISKQLMKAKKEIKELKEKNEALKRMYKSNKRQLQRNKKRYADTPNTPRSKAAKLIQDLKLTPEQSKTVQKELVFANVVCEEITKTAHKAPQKTKKALRNILSGNILKKYRCVSKFGAKTGMCRNKIAKVDTKCIDIQKISRCREIAAQRNRVIAFFERDDNSRNMPGKADCVKSIDGTKSQKRVLTDYLSSLFSKFMSENPKAKLSFSSFCRIRPQRICLTSCITRDTCLCTKHQNISLTLKAARKHNVDTTINPEKMLERKDEIMKSVENDVKDDTIVVGQWKRVTVETKGQKKSVMKIVDEQMTKAEFVGHIKTQVAAFEEHSDRIKTQYKEMKCLKENLPENHCIVHMDFAENYSCKSVQEIQSAYWNQTSVTLHPIVIYYKVPGSTEMLHKSIVVISDEMGHNSASVLTFMDTLIPEIKQLNSATTCIHYWTDSPTSQYRNKVIFHTVANHNSLFGLEATWNYWEAGHGKGPCDGLGGTVKRMADDAVKSGKVAIQDTSDFYAWTQSPHCTMKSVKFIFVSTERCQEKAIEIGKLKLKPISGTMKIHAVKGKGNSNIAVRNTSCYCEICIVSSSSTCSTWRNETVEPRSEILSSAKSPEDNDTPQSEAIICDSINADTNIYIEEGDYVAAIYLRNWYIGKITDVDKEDKTVEISFLERKKKSFQWPCRPDVIWVQHSDIICKISPPVHIGKSKRMLAMDEGDLKNVEALFDQL